MLCHNFISLFCTEMCKRFLKTYLHVLLITKIILLKWLLSAIMPKSVSNVSDQWKFFGLFTVFIWVSWRHSTWRHDNYVKKECHSTWRLDNWVKNQGQKIIIALILLSLDPIVKSGLHSQGYNKSRQTLSKLPYFPSDESQSGTKLVRVIFFWEFVSTCIIINWKNNLIN